MTKESFTHDDYVTFKQIDHDVTKILVQASQECIKCGDHPWSPQLHESYLKHYYWNLKLSEKCTRCPYPQAYQQIEARIPHDKLSKYKKLTDYYCYIMCYALLGWPFATGGFPPMVWNNWAPVKASIH